MEEEELLKNLMKELYPTNVGHRLCSIKNRKMNGASQRKYNHGTKAGNTIINILLNEISKG